uniref:Terminase small subunit n=1 Tax=Caulobacter phage BL57 TaxID=3348355 RepID=A0AB74UH14_9VIRU
MTDAPTTVEDYAGILVDDLMRLPADEREGVRARLIECFPIEDLKVLVEGATAAAQRAAQAMSLAIRREGLILMEDGKTWSPPGRGAEVRDETVQMLIKIGNLEPYTEMGTTVRSTASRSWKG